MLQLVRAICSFTCLLNTYLQTNTTISQVTTTDIHSLFLTTFLLLHVTCIIVETHGNLKKKISWGFFSLLFVQ